VGEANLFGIRLTLPNFCGFVEWATLPKPWVAIACGLAIIGQGDTSRDALQCKA